MPIAYRHPTRAQLPVVIAPVSGAVARLRGKRITPTHLDSGEIATLPLAAREAGFFAAKVAKAETLSILQRNLDKALSLPAGEAFKGRAAFAADTRRAMGAAPGDSGKLTDITSGRRLGIIYDFQLEDAYSHARWTADQDPDIRDEYPAQEFLRVESRKNVRTDWPRRWAEAGGKTFQGRMIAAIDDPVWEKLSRFGRPWPPYDYGSGMGVQSIDREEAEALGVIRPGQPVRSPAKAFDDKVVASTRRLSPEMVEALKDEFSGAIHVREDGFVEFFKPGKAELLIDHEREKMKKKFSVFPQIPPGEYREFLRQKPTVSAGGKSFTWQLRHLESDRNHAREYRKELLPAAADTLENNHSIPNPERPDDPRQRLFFKEFGNGDDAMGMAVLTDENDRAWNYFPVTAETLTEYRRLARAKEKPPEGGSRSKS